MLAEDLIRNLRDIHRPAFMKRLHILVCAAAAIERRCLVDHCLKFIHERRPF